MRKLFVRPETSEPTRPGWLLRGIRRWYRHLIVPRVSDPMKRQRLKMVWYLWGYWPLVKHRGLSRRARFELLRRFLRIDWNVLHAHLPSEMSILCQMLTSRPARPGEIIVEAGCWRGGSSAKFSLLARMLGYQLFIYDSFEGVEQLAPEQAAAEWEFGGQYASTEAVLRENLARYGETSVCTIQKGWFAETLAANPVPHPIRLAYIDCDLAKGTKEALNGIVPSLVDDGCVFSQDFHIEPVRRMLLDRGTWESFGRGMPVITQRGEFLASIRFPKQTAT
jgi:O-methyltransferase